MPRYKKETARELMSLLSPREELLHLPDETTIRMVATPHPFGGVVITYEDVTDTLRVERLYNTLIQVQRETLDHLFEGIVVFGSDGRLKLSNPAYARMWGLQPADIEGEPHVSAITDRIRSYFPAGLHWPRLRQRIISRVADREPRRGRLERSDGSVLVFSSLPLPDGGCLYTYLDVTDTTRVERALRERNAALETADRLKSEFIANVSYELRTPLNAIIGFAEILNQSYFGTLNERQSEYARGILDASNRLISLINDILDIATIEAGYLHLELASVDVCHLLAAVETFAVERARNRNLQFAIDCPEGIGAVIGDERRLKQAIYNVVSNAIKFTPPGGRIVISARSEDEMMSITVTDTGIGIDPQDQGIIFEKFARVSSQGRQTGAGLGLALVKKLVELHSGTVELQSTPGEGTQVTCHVPIAGPPAARGAQAAD
jgi:signal transduction histidine kinase